MDSPFAAKPTLVGELVVLRPVRGDDAEAIGAIIRDPEVAALTGTVHARDEVPAFTPAQLRAAYEGWAEASDRLVLAVIDRASGALVGEVVLNDWDEANRSCGFRTFLGAAGRGRGLGTEATRLIVRYAFDELGLHRIALNVYDFNPRARHVYEKVGFVHEGTGREALRFDDGWVDVHFMAILASDGAAEAR